MESTENDRAASRFCEVFSVDCVRVDPGIADQSEEHLVILLLDRVVQRRQSSLVSDVEVEDLALVLLVQESHVAQSLVLFLAECEMDWSGRHPVDQIEIDSKGHALLQDLECRDGVFVILYEEEVDHVGADSVENIRIDLVLEAQHLKCNLELVRQDRHMKRVSVLETLQVEVKLQ